MKRVCTIVLCVALLLCCTACFRSPEDETPKTSTSTSTTTSTTMSTTTTTLPSGSTTGGSQSGVGSTTTGSNTSATSGTTGTTAQADAVVPVAGFTSFPATGWATDSLIVRDAPSTDGTYIGGLAKGSDVTVHAQEGEWYRISYNSSEIGWTDQAYVNAAYLSATEPTY